MRKFLNQCEESLAHTGLAVLDTSMLYAMLPSQWTSSQAALLDGVNPLKLVHALKAQQPNLTFIECDLQARRVLVAVRSLVHIEDRLEALTGHRPSAIKEVQPTTARFIENTRVPEIKKPVEPEFPPDFDPIAFEKEIPVHDCHVRRQMLAKLERDEAIFDQVRYSGRGRAKRLRVSDRAWRERWSGLHAVLLRRVQAWQSDIRLKLARELGGRG